MDTIELMRTFVTVATEGSFTGAAKRLGMPLQTVSKYVRQLEERLKAQLFDRTTRKISLNDTGRAYLERCVDLLDQFDDLESAVAAEHSAPKGRIRITGPTSFGEMHLVGALAIFQQRYPEIRFEVNLTNRKIALVEEGYDLGIRIGLLSDSATVARKLCAMRFPIVASPDYIRRYGRPLEPRELEHHPCVIDTNLIDPLHWPFLIDTHKTHIAVKGNFQVNAPHATRRVALSGSGIARCPMYVVAEDIATEKLHVLLEEFEWQEAGVYAMYPHRRHLSTRVRVLVDFLAQRFS